MKSLVLLIFSLIFITSLTSQDLFTHRAIESIDSFRHFLSIPNDANNLDDIYKNVSWCERQLERRGFKTQVWQTDTRPVMFADRAVVDKSLPTVLFYFHADGQSVDPQFWFQDDPYVAVLKEEQTGEGWVDIDWSNLTTDSYDADWRIFGRSSSDSKCNIMMFLAGLDMLNQEGIKIPYNLKVIIDFEEEKSSPSLADIVELKKESLAADMLVIYDGPRHVSEQPTISFGARGIATVTLTVYGPIYAQHSGHYGNYAPNPAFKLSKLLSSMKDDEGRVLIDGYYDGVMIDDATEAILDQVPDDEAMINAKLGIARAEAVSDSYQKSLQYPSLNVRGMASGWVGAEARTIVPSQAVAEIDIRLVKESDPNRLIRLVKNHIESQGFFIVDDKPTQRERLEHDKICRMSSNISYKAFRTEFDSDAGNWLTRALTNAFGEVPVRERTMGGSIPISPFVQILEAPAVVIPLANKDNNQHSPNENLRLGNYVDGVKTMYFILKTPVF